MSRLLPLLMFLAVAYPAAVAVADDAAADAAPPGGPASPATITALLEDYAAATGVPIADLDGDVLRALAAGDIVHRKVRVSAGESTAMRIVGYRVIDKPRESLWLAALAYDGGYSDRLTEHLLATHDDGGASWYQHVDMPWPLRDRHWLIRTGKGVALARHSGGRIWEHHWRLAPHARQRIDALLARDDIPGLSTERAHGAIDLPRNDGAWVMMRLGESKTLVMLHATMDMGGFIPDSLVNRHTRRQLASMLERIARRADAALTDYGDDYVIYRGDGTPIEPAITTAATE